MTLSRSTPSRLCEQKRWGRPPSSNQLRLPIAGPPEVAPVASEAVNAQLLEMLHQFPTMSSPARAGSAEVAAGDSSQQSFPPPRERVVPGFANFSRLKGKIACIPEGADIPMFDPNAKDGRFTDNCPFCGIGTSRPRPTKVYRNLNEYRGTDITMSAAVDGDSVAAHHSISASCCSMV
ncbi:hypothetical protein AB1Y20_016748 [Prymnesium parvum]|uniref:Uncharacterized protein n=1 Tax=Prymnesium parvum TaxID=97485 RepID=A0AB34ICR6_PRYPA